ncbi:sugar ABC transporter substrate-binding protein [Cohnella thermotolerans]|uniref:sugar ABC transporter substrate-binding protein n=1 Tax=Cohnella thermotolerans TaxID=329858 RepID=UPI00041DFA10|nr:sugar ABC transporter substrate-binding protein [Cohnella thermotolerans]
MRKNKVWALVFIVTLIAATMAGCGSDKKNASSNEPSDSAKSSSSASAPADGKTGGEKKKLKIGAAMPIFDDKWLSYLYDSMKKAASENDVDLVMVDAKNDNNTQLTQMETFVSEKVDAILLVPVQTEAVDPMLEAAKAANIPVVVVNRKPNESALKDIYAYVGSDSLVAGTIQMEKVAELLGGKGNIGIMNGQLGQEAVVNRTQGNKNVIAKYPDLKLIREATANWQRSEGMTLMENWIQSGEKFDAIVANNDEMAIGAIMALEAAGKLDKTIVAGIDGTVDALDYVKSGKLKVTAFQDPMGQGKVGLETAIKAARGEKIDNKMIDVPFEVITPDNVDVYFKKWGK